MQMWLRQKSKLPDYDIMLSRLKCVGARLILWKTIKRIATLENCSIMLTNEKNECLKYEDKAMPTDFLVTEHSVELI
jgi:hypothetical protein